MHLIDSCASGMQSQTNTPLAILSFDCDGNFSTFSPELLTMSHPTYGDFLFGNVFEDRLEDLPTSPKFQRVYQDIQRGIDLCQSTCPYFAICGGGSPSNKPQEHDTFVSTETMACRLQVQAPADVLLEHLESRYDLPSPSSRSFP